MKRILIVLAIVIYALACFGLSQANNGSDKLAILKNAQIVTARRTPPLVGWRPVPSPQIVIKAARLIDGRGGPPLEPAMVHIEGEKIVEVGTRLTIPKGAGVIDLGNATLLPGLIDLHTHLTDRYDTHWEEALVKTTPGHNALWGARNTRVTLLAGFTTCRDMGPTWPYVKYADLIAVPGDPLKDITLLERVGFRDQRRDRLPR